MDLKVTSFPPAGFGNDGISPFNLVTMVATMTEMELVIGIIFKKALAEPHYCE